MRGIRNNLFGSSGHRIQILAEPGINVWKLSTIDRKGKVNQKNVQEQKQGCPGSNKLPGQPRLFHAISVNVKTLLFEFDKLAIPYLIN